MRQTVADHGLGGSGRPTEFMAVSGASIDEMFVINGAGLERLGALLAVRAWDADAAALRDLQAGQ
jgi:hypothetical protein